MANIDLKVNIIFGMKMINDAVLNIYGNIKVLCNDNLCESFVLLLIQHNAKHCINLMMFPHSQSFRTFNY